MFSSIGIEFPIVMLYQNSALVIKIRYVDARVQKRQIFGKRVYNISSSVCISEFLYLPYLLLATILICGSIFLHIHYTI